MKIGIFAVAAICLLSISAYAEYECDTEYHDKLKKLKSLTETEISDEAKNKYISRLEKAYQLCKDGKKEQAVEILAELKEEHDFNTVFSTHDGN